MSTEFGKAYEVLGVKPGVSVRELKAAHRDLAKVWHPDRFLHDPRLQQKAQEKLKEINEAYEQLISRKATREDPRRPPPTRRNRQWHGVSASIAARMGLDWRVLMFMAVFAVTISALASELVETVLARHRDRQLENAEQVYRS